MIKTHRVKLNLTRTQFELVREKQMESANCWNYINNGLKRMIYKS